MSTSKLILIPFTFPDYFIKIIKKDLTKRIFDDDIITNGRAFLANPRLVLKQAIEQSKAKNDVTSLIFIAGLSKRTALLCPAAPALPKCVTLRRDTLGPQGSHSLPLRRKRSASASKT